MPIKREIIYLSTALSLVAFFITFALDMGQELLIPLKVLFWVLMLVGVVLGVLRIEAFYALHSQQTIEFEGKRYLMMQIRHHVVFVDPARLPQAITIVSPADHQSLHVKHDGHNDLNQGRLDILFPPLPPIEGVSSLDFRRHYD